MIIDLLLVELSVKKEDIYSLIEENDLLNNVIDNLIKELNSQNIEIFHRDNNILVCENGYYLAVWENTVEIEEIIDETKTNKTDAIKE